MADGLDEQARQRLIQQILAMEEQHAAEAIEAPLARIRQRALERNPELMAEYFGPEAGYEAEQGLMESERASQRQRMLEADPRGMSILDLDPSQLPTFEVPEQFAVNQLPNMNFDTPEPQSGEWLAKYGDQGPSDNLFAREDDLLRKPLPLVGPSPGRRR